MDKLTMDILENETRIFAQDFSVLDHKKLYGVTDGKSIGTYVEKKFFKFLENRDYEFERGFASRGLDFPGLNTDIKVTSTKQLQSSSPYTSPRQKIFGLGYNLVVFEYNKKDLHHLQVAQISIDSIKYIDKEETGDKALTTKINEIINEGDLVYTKLDNLLQAEFGKLISAQDREDIIDELMIKPPKIGKIGLTVALQWRVRY